VQRYGLICTVPEVTGIPQKNQIMENNIGGTDISALNMPRIFWENQ
jgi:hypothetical protein